MATYFDPASGQFERGTPSTSSLADPQAQPQTRQNFRGGTQVNVRTDDQTGEQTITSTPARQGRWHDASEFARGGEVERTIRSGKTGNPVMNRAYNGNDTVEVGGQRMSLNLAAGLGLIHRDANGGFSFSGDAGSDRAPQTAAPQQRPQGQPQGQPNGNPEGEPQGETFRASDAAETAITALTQSTMQQAQIAALNAVVETGQVSAAVIERLAQNSGQEPGQIAQQVQQVYDGFHGAISSRLEGAGVHDLELFDAFVEGDQRRHSAMKKAVRDLMMHNDASGFDRLAGSYREALDQIDPEGVKEALDAAGIKHWRGDGGAIVMNLPGHGEVSYRAALKAGLIKVSRG